MAGGNNFGKNIGKSVGNLANKAKNRADNGKDYDVMNPEAEDPNMSAAKKQGAKNGLKALKAVGKAVVELGKALVKFLVGLGPPGWIALAIIIILLIVAVIFTSWNMMPGMMKQKLADLFKIDIGSWFMNGAVASLDKDYEDIINVANYLESMDYSLIGDGFVTPNLRTSSSSTKTIGEILAIHPEYTYSMGDDEKNHFYDESGNIVSLSYYDNIGQTVDNTTGDVTSGDEYQDEFGIWRKTEFSESSDGNDRGKISKIEEADLKHYRLLRSYLLSDYRIYTLKNMDESFLVTIGDAFRSLGGNHDAWAKGLIKLYNAKGGYATGHWWWGRGILGESVSMNETTLSLKKGWFNNAMNFKIEGWAPRYGMSLDFLISLHLGTKSPDMVYAMLQNFDTEVQVYLDDSGKSKVNARYIDPSVSGRFPGSGDSIEKVETVLDENGDWLSSWLVTDKSALEWFANDLALDKEACQVLLTSDELTLTSQDNCLGEASAYIIEDCSYQVSDLFGLIDTSSDALSGYGLNESNAKVYNNISTFQPNDFSYEKSGWFGSKSVTDATFDATHVTQQLGVDDDYKDEHYTILSADKYGFNDAKSGKQELEPVTSGFEVKSSFLNSEDVYYCEETIQERHWTHEVDGEDVGYTWMTYKYIIWYEGTNVTYWDPFAINGGSGGIFHTNTTMLGDAKWEDTVICEYIVRDKTRQEMIDSGLMNEDGTPIDTVDQRCSQNKSKDKCCANCQIYVKAAVKAMANVSDQDYSSYTPYIARVVGSWFRDTYFIIPDEPDVAIKEYSGNIQTDARSYDADGDGSISDDEEEDAIIATNHPEFNVANSYYNDSNTSAVFVSVDEEYLADSGEYWTLYETKDDGDYQLYVLKSNGRTSNTKMEDFLKDGKIDGADATINGTAIGSSPYGPTSTKEQIQKAKENAEKYGWAFVKKAIVEDLSKFSAEHTLGKDESDRMDDHIVWSAYGFDSNGAATAWEKVTRADSNKDVNALYDIIYGQDEEGDVGSGIFYQLETTNNVGQVEDAQRAETNALVKYLFKYRKFYIYDGSDERGVQIEHDKQRVMYGYNDYVNQGYDFEGNYYTDKKVADAFDIRDAIAADSSINRDNFYSQYKGLIDHSGNGLLLNEYYGTSGDGWKSKVIDLLDKYGRSALRQSYAWSTISDWIDPEDLAQQWLDWQLDMYYMNKFGVDIPSYYNESGKDTSYFLKLKYDPRDPDLVGTVEITKSSLSVFSILENTGTLDADYAYRDFKELIVELDYFDKEDLSSKYQEVFTWVLPEVSPAGWPNRPWDKQNVDYGTLIQSHDTYEALGVFNGTSGLTNSNVKEDTIFWIGDSWINMLGNSGVASAAAGSGSSGQITSGYFFCKGGMNADWVLDNYSSMSIPADTSAIVVEFGLNGVTNWGKTQELITKLKADHGNIPVFVLQTSYICSGYPFSSPSKSQIDTYNSNMKSYADSTDGVTYVDPTGNINSGGYLKDEYAQNASDMSQGGGKIHLNQAGIEVWYKDILGALGAGGSSSSPSLTQTVSTGSSGGYEIKDLDENASDNPDHMSHIVTANGIEFRQFNQSGHYGSVDVYSGNTQVRTDSGDRTLSGMGCGIYSSTALMSAYIQDVNPKNTVEWLHDNIGTSAFNNGENRYTSINKMLGDRGIPGDWYSDNYDTRLKEAFSAGKPVIINIQPGSNNWTTTQGHFICFVGISSDGKVYTADSVSGGGSRLCHSEGTDFDSAISTLLSDLNIGRVWIPNEAPTGIKQSSALENSVVFQGYEADQNVSSPVTGKIIEIGTHDRLNIYTGEMEKVEYITLLVMDRADYFDDIATGSNDDYGYETETPHDTVAKALNLFYKEYEDVCAGYTITIDGFDVDLSIEGGTYAQNPIQGYALYNSGQWEIRKEREQAKEDAPFFINCGESDDVPGDTYQADPDSIVGYYVKEGKYIGKTITSDAPIDSTDSDATDPAEATETEDSDTESTSGGDLPDKLTYTYEDFAKIPDLTGDYMRIQIKDTDYALVDDIENFFDIPEGEGTSVKPFSGDYSEEFLYWMLILCEGLTHQEVTQGYSVATDIGDDTITAAMGVTNWCNEIFWNLGYEQYMHGQRGSNIGMNVGDQIPIDVLRDVALAELDQAVTSLQEEFSSLNLDEYQMAALLSVQYNFGSVPSSLKNALLSGDSSARSIWENLGSSQWAQYPGLASRRKGEAVIYFDKKWIGPYSGNEITFMSQTPFSDYLNGNFSVASE